MHVIITFIFISSVDIYITITTQLTSLFLHSLEVALLKLIELLNLYSLLSCNLCYTQSVIGKNK